MTTGERIKLRRKETGISAETLADRIGVSPATVYRYEKGDIEKVPGNLLEPIADALSTTPAYLMGWSDQPEDYDEAEELNDLPSDWYSHFNGDTRSAVQAYRAMERDRAEESASRIKTGVRRRIPLVGAIACGAPITAEENIEDWVAVPAYIRADFALRCRGDSMKDARILDGDLVCIRKQDDVDDGQIAAVLIDDEATLKRVHHLPGGGILLQAANSAYLPIVAGGVDETRHVRILGIATHFISRVV